MSLAVSVLSLLDDLYALTPEQIDGEIAELERRLERLRSLRAIVANQPEVDRPQLSIRRKRIEHYSPEQIAEFRRRIKQTIVDGGGVISHEELRRRSNLSAVQASRALDGFTDVVRTPGKRYKLNPAA